LTPRKFFRYFEAYADISKPGKYSKGRGGENRKPTDADGLP